MKQRSTPLVSRLRLPLLQKTAETNKSAKVEDEKLLGCMSVNSLSESLSKSYKRHMDTSAIKSSKPKVTFSHVNIRSYNRTVGLNPTVSSGPALDLSWEYGEEEMYPFSEFEEDREVNRRSITELVITRREREKILRFDFEVQKSRIASCIRSINKTKAQRRQTLNNLKFAHVEEKLQKMTRVVMRSVGLKKKTKDEIAHLWKQAAKRSIGGSSSSWTASVKTASTALSNSSRRMISSVRSNSSISAWKFKKRAKEETLPKKDSIDVCSHSKRYDLQLDFSEEDELTEFSSPPEPNASTIESKEKHISQTHDSKQVNSQKEPITSATCCPHCQKSATGSCSRKSSESSTTGPQDDDDSDNSVSNIDRYQGDSNVSPKYHCEGDIDNLSLSTHSGVLSLSRSAGTETKSFVNRLVPERHRQTTIIAVEDDSKHTTQ